MIVKVYQIILLFLALNAHAVSVDTNTSVVKRPDGSKIDYYLLKHSKNISGNVLFLFLHGSDCNSVMNIDSIFTDYKNIWPNADLLLIDKYGIDKNLVYSSDAERKDCPLDYLEKDNPEQRVADIKIVLKNVRKDTAYEKIVVVGGSEGAVIANLFTTSVDYVDATISFNGGGRWFVDDVLYNISSLDSDNESKGKAIEGFKGFSEQILTSDPFDAEVSGHGYMWWRQMLSIDQYKVLKKVKSPLLVIQGGIDLSVSPKKVDEMMFSLRKSGNTHIEYFRYERLDHGFVNSKGESGLKHVVADMNGWLKSIL